jgi:DNA/RNA-binding domain of Phe-tRNA-synthetase-like protein
VDVYNIVSALTGISVGAHDTGKLVSDARLEFIPQDIRFRMIGKGGEDVAEKGEYGYTDDSGIICRMDIKQSERTKVTEQTHDILVIFQGHDTMGEVTLRQGLRLLDEAINTLFV